MTDKTKDFIVKAVEVHGDKYDYSLVEYINTRTKVKIICKIHGEFEQNPNNHLKGSNCSKCCGTQQKTTEQFIDEAQQIHGNKYNYSKVNYTNSNNKVIIICKEHGEFEQRAIGHLTGKGCSLCGIGKNKLNRTTPQNDFIIKSNEIHHNKYDYSKVIYTNSNTKIIIICKEHGEFEQLPIKHLNGQGCTKCGYNKNSIKRTKSFDDFVNESNKIHGNNFDYSKTKYINSKIKTTFICKKHGEFEQTPANHLLYGCPNCVNKTEGKLYEQLQVLFPNIIQQFKVDWCKNKSYLPFDFCIGEHKIIIELDGDQHFRQVSNWETPEKTQETDKYKMECANANGYSVIRLLQEDVFKDKYEWKTELVNNINKIISECKIQNIYMCKNNEYKKYKSKKSNKEVEIDL